MPKNTTGFSILSGCIKYKYIVIGDKINLNTKKLTINNMSIIKDYFYLLILNLKI